MPFELGAREARELLALDGRDVLLLVGGLDARLLEALDDVDLELVLDGFGVLAYFLLLFGDFEGSLVLVRSALLPLRLFLDLDLARSFSNFSSRSGCFVLR